MLDEIVELIKNHDYAKIHALFLSMNAADAAEELEDMDEASAVRIFRMLPKDMAAEVFAHLDSHTQQSIVEAITDREISDILNDLFLDDAVDFIEEMPASVVKRVLANVSRQNREYINQLLKYPEDSVGSVMTIEYVALRRTLTVAEAFERIRRTGPDKETIYTIYITDGERRLIGTVSAKALMLASPDETIESLMETNIISACTGDDKETLANDFVKYGLLAMPVVDNENRLVGIVTVDDILEVQQEEATEDFEIMAAISPSEDPYLRTSVLTLAKNRVPWLLLLMLSATITGAIITGFEDALLILPALVSFIPMLMDTGGNAGSQSSTLTIRGLALGEIKLPDAGRVMFKEIRVALLCGAALVTVNFIRIMIMGYGLQIAIVVSLTLLVTVSIAKMLGGLLPMLAKKLGLDPAVMATPIITTLVDACTLIVYFLLARFILGI